jgi:hypothetical protein
MTMRLAYFIMVHDNPSQFRWLWRAIHQPEDIFAIHIDAKTSAEDTQRFHETINGPPNFIMLPRIEIHWGGWNLAKIEIDAIRCLLEFGGKWDYFINLSGYDYPLRCRAEIAAYLREWSGLNFINSRPIDDYSKSVRTRTEWVFRVDGGQVVKTNTPLPRPKHFELGWKGSNWHMLSRNFCDWLVSSELLEEICDHLQHTFIPDEFLMQTVIMNSTFRETRADNMRKVIWPGPKFLRMEDEKELLCSQDFFARKFDAKVDERILRVLAGHIGAKVP